jgi:VanZ family protein
MVAMLVLLAAVLEMAQLWQPGRHSQFIDFAASSAGACLGMLAVAVVDRFGLADAPG